MIISVHQAQYLPWLGYFHKIFSSDAFVFLDDVQYKKREYQNRNRIRAKDRWIWLTVPVTADRNPYPVFSDVYVDNSQDWARSHWKSLYLNYAKAPYFERYSGFFEGLYRKEWRRLLDLNIEIVSYLNSVLGIEKPVRLSSELDIKTQKTERILDICEALGADTYLSGGGGRDYLDEEKFRKAGIRLVYQDFEHPVYRQLHMKDEKDFLAEMSIVDLIFNHGPGSMDILLGGKSG